jgi:hypothetical protein
MNERWAFFLAGAITGGALVGWIVKSGARRAMAEIQRLHLAVLAENSVLRKSLDAFTK